MYARRDSFPVSIPTMLLQTIFTRLRASTRAAALPAVLLGAAAVLSAAGGLASTAAALPYPSPARVSSAPAAHAASKPAAHKKRKKPAPKHKPARKKRPVTHPAAPAKSSSQSTATSSKLPPPPASAGSSQQKPTTPLSPGSPVTSAPVSGSAPPTTVTTPPSSGTTPPLTGTTPPPATTTPPSTTTLPPTAPLPFALTSVWNAPLSPTAALDPGSANMISGLDAEVTREEQAAIGPWITVGANIYTVGPNQPTVTVQLTTTTGPVQSALRQAFMAVPIPTGAQPGGDSDEELTVWQPSTDKLWEFFHMQLLSDGWHATWGGAMDNVAESPGYFNSGSWPGASTSWGATASSLPQAAGVITMADVEQGQIDHALAVNLPYPCHTIYSWPGQRTDGAGTASNCIPEGAHLRLDPTLNIPALHLPRFVQMMAEAAQTYGIVVRDQTKWAIGFWIQSPASAGVGNPFYNSSGNPTSTGPFQGKWPNQLMSYFPWGSLQVVQMSGPGIPAGM
jgi:hypothetical protein